MAYEFEFYNCDDGYRYLQLHDDRTLWNVDGVTSEELYWLQVEIAIREMEQHYKDLKIYALGRNGRHICIDDTPINRRRYTVLVNYALKAEDRLVDIINAKFQQQMYEQNQEEEKRRRQDRA